jgi:hypothetical protein
MPAGWFVSWDPGPRRVAPPKAMRGKSRGVTKPPARAKRRNRRKPLWAEC